MFKAGRISRNNPPDAGFTMVELVVVLVLIGLMTAVTLPVFTPALEALKFKAAARKIASTFNYARSTAVFRQAPQGVTFDMDENTYSIEGVTVNNGTEPRRTTATVSLPPQVAITAMDVLDDNAVAGGGKIIFYPDGSSSYGSVTIRNKVTDESVRIAVDIFTGSPVVSFLVDEER
jgi:general secretion pathway protein H